MTDETHRFFQIKDRTIYESLCEFVDDSRGYPDGNGTERGLPVWDKLFADPETTTDKLYCLDRWRFKEGDDEPLQAALDAGVIVEIDLDTYMQRLRWEPPVVEEDLEEEEDFDNILEFVGLE
jgi:hypothetical protein